MCQLGGGEAAFGTSGLAEDHRRIIAADEKPFGQLAGCRLDAKEAVAALDCRIRRQHRTKDRFHLAMRGAIERGSRECPLAAELVACEANAFEKSGALFRIAGSCGERFEAIELLGKLPRFLGRVQRWKIRRANNRGRAVKRAPVRAARARWSTLGAIPRR